MNRYMEFLLFYSSFIVWAISTVAMGICVIRVSCSIESTDSTIKWAHILPFAIVSITIVIFTAIFIVGNGAPTFQVSGSTSLWELWYEIYFPLLVINLVSFVIGLVNCFYLPTSYKFKDTGIYTVVVLITCVQSLGHVFVFYPSA